MSNPFSSRKTIDLVRLELGKVDYLKRYQQQVNWTTKLAIDLMQTPETLRQKESFPILEDSYITSRIWESVELLRREMGPCDMGNRDSVHISKYLKRFAPIITQNCLSANAVYNLLTFVTPGQT